GVGGVRVRGQPAGHPRAAHAGGHRLGLSPAGRSAAGRGEQRARALAAGRPVARDPATVDPVSRRTRALALSAARKRTTMSWGTLTDKLVTLGIAGFLLKAVGAVAVWIIGRRLIRFAVTVSMNALRRQTVDETLLVYLSSTLSVLLNVALVIAILGYFGVE